MWLAACPIATSKSGASSRLRRAHKVVVIGVFDLCSDASQSGCDRFFHVPPPPVRFAGECHRELWISIKCFEVGLRRLNERM